MKKYKRGIIVLMVIAMILIPINISNATNTLTPDSTETTLNEIEHNGVTIKTNEIIPGATFGFVNVTIEGTNLTENLAGCTGTIYFNGGHTPCLVESLSENWTIQTQRTENNFISFIVEKNDLENTENSVTLEIKYRVDWTSCSKDTWTVGTGNISDYTEFVTADSQNNCYYPFNDLEENHTIQVALKESSIYAVTGEPTTEDYIRIDNENKEIYIKLDGKLNGFGTVEDLISRLNFNIGVMNFIWYGRDGSSWSTLPADNSKTSVGDIYSILFCAEEGNFQYSVKQMGNVWQDDVYSGGVVNINDVLKLRKAIIEDQETLNSPYFDIKCSDVNFSNSDLGEIGDIGDIISIRQRILKSYWIDCSVG